MSSSVTPRPRATRRKAIRPAHGMLSSEPVARAPWKKSDPLFRGDDAAGPSVPDSTSKTSVVAHILYLGGRGRPTPFSSTTESEEVAEYFAGPHGKVWETSAPRATGAGAKHVPRKQLLQNLKGFGKGSAKWDDAFEVAQAANYVEQWSEHLLDWRGAPSASLGQAIARAFKKRT